MHLPAVVSRPSGVHYEEPCGLSEYEGLLSQLKELSKEITNNSQEKNNNLSKRNKSQLTHCSSCGNKSTFYHLIYNKKSNKLE
jgi:hypothetical protein